MSTSKSFYAIETSIRPGYARHHEIFVVNQAEDARKVLTIIGRTALLLFAEDTEAVFDLIICQQGKFTRVNMFPLTHFQLPGYPRFQVNKIGIQSEVADWDANAFWQHLDLDICLAFLANPDYTIDIVWDAVPLMPLDPPTIQPGDEASTDKPLKLGYGYNEFENHGEQDEDWQSRLKMYLPEAFNNTL